jgi:hypothetical protein
LVAIYPIVALQWMDPQAARQIAASYSINKATLGRSVHGSHFPLLCFSVLGESEKMELVKVFCGAADLRQELGSSDWESINVSLVFAAASHGRKATFPALFVG